MLSVNNDSKQISFTSALKEGAELAKHLNLHRQRAIEVNCFETFLKQDGKDYLAVLGHDVFKCQKNDNKFILVPQEQDATGVAQKIAKIIKKNNLKNIDEIIERRTNNENIDIAAPAALFIHKMSDTERAVKLMEQQFEKLDLEHHSIALNAASNAGRFSDSDLAVSLVKKHIKHPDVSIQHGIASSVGCIADSKKAEDLIDWIMNQKKLDMDIKGRAIESIQYANDIKIRDSVIKKYEDYAPGTIFDMYLARIAGLLSNPDDAVALIRKLTNSRRAVYNNASLATESVKYITDPQAQSQILNELKRHGSSQVRWKAHEVENELIREDDKLKDYNFQIKQGDIILHQTVIEDKEDMNLFSELLSAYKTFTQKFSK